MDKSKTFPAVDKYLLDGCMRCKFGATPDCKVNLWSEELNKLRQIIISCGLTEELKWSVPCYTHNGQNILLLSAFKNYCCISFFKGTLMSDPDSILEKPGESSQAVRLIKFTNTKQINIKKIKKYISEAIKIEESGLKVSFTKKPELIPSELTTKFETSPKFKKAFYALTPGRQRGYIIHFSKAKQSKTRTDRIEKSIPKILDGKGMQDR